MQLWSVKGPMYTLAEVIEEFVDLKLAGEPAYSHWASIKHNGEARNAYYERLIHLKKEINRLSRNSL